LLADNSRACVKRSQLVRAKVRSGGVRRDGAGEGKASKERPPVELRWIPPTPPTSSAPLRVTATACSQ